MSNRAIKIGFIVGAALLLLLFSMIGTGPQRDYQIEVEYTNNQKDTLYFEARRQDLVKLSNSGCLRVGYSNLVCGIRKYKILNKR